MNNLINKLIYNHLAAGQGVNLPGIGALVVEYAGARFASRKRLIPPQRQVRYQLHERAGLPSAIDLLETQTGDRRHAEAVYGAWLEDLGARGGRTPIDIEGVGKVSKGDFVLSPWLEKALNPQTTHPIRIRPRCRWWWIVVLVLLLAGAGYCLRGQIASWNPSLPRISWEWTKGLGDVFSFGRKQMPLPAPKVDTTAIVAADSLAADSLLVDSVAAIDTPALPRYHLILGAYSTPERAESAIRQFRRRDTSLDYRVVMRSRQYLVSGYASPDRAQVDRRQVELFDTWPESWVFEQKEEQ